MSQVQFNTQLTDQITVSDEAVKQLLALTESEEGVSGIRILFQAADAAACLTA